MGNSQIEAKKTDKDKPQEKQTVEVILNIGVFFDGTNNNKVQSSIALTKRRTDFFNKYKSEIQKQFPEVKNLLSISRTQLVAAHIGTINELDNVYGYSDTIDLTVEKKIATDNLSEYRYSSSAEKYDAHKNKGLKGKISKFFKDDATRERLRRNAGMDADKVIFNKKIHSISTSQGSGYTNVAILNSFYETSETRKDDESTAPLEFYYSIYVEGSGANEEISVIKQLGTIIDSVIGLGFGVDEYGIVAKCSKAVRRVNDIYQSQMVKENVTKIDCYFDLFGFSRGATTARCFTYILNPKKVEGYVDKKLSDLICGNGSSLLEKTTLKLGMKSVRTLGLFDTVSSIGVLREGTSYILGDKVLGLSKKYELKKTESIFHDTNVDDFGLYSTDQADNVLHLCALDEYRKNFALVDIESSIKANNGSEVYIPGCHTDVGGGASMGLDAFKIINCDEIATRGDIIHNLYIRINGIIELLKGIDEMISSMAETFAAIQGVTSIPMAYFTIQKIIPSLHKSACGWFSMITGYESPAAYRAKNGLPEPPSQMIQPGVGFSVLEDFNNAVQNIINTIESSDKNIDRGVKAAIGIVSGDTVTKVMSVISLIETGLNVVNSLKGCVKSIQKIIDDFDKMGDVGPDEMAMIVVRAEKAKWHNQKVQLEESIDIFQMVFNVKNKEKLIIPFEQRRICMYTGKPFDKSVKRDRSKKTQIKPVTADLLRELGWLDKAAIKEENGTWMTGRPSEKSIKDAQKNGKSIFVEGTKVAHFITRQNIGIQKYATPGYTMIGLHAMYEWANKAHLFMPLPESAYKIPQDLVPFYVKVSAACEKTGRHICVPNDSLYTFIRNKYLHLSINQQILSMADNGVVNGPSFMTVESGLSDKEREKLVADKKIASKDESFKFDNVITRRIYSGMKRASTSGGKLYEEIPKQSNWYLG